MPAQLPGQRTARSRRRGPKQGSARWATPLWWCTCRQEGMGQAGQTGAGGKASGAQLGGRQMGNRIGTGFSRPDPAASSPTSSGGRGRQAVRTTGWLGLAGGAPLPSLCSPGTDAPCSSSSSSSKQDKVWSSRPEQQSGSGGKGGHQKAAGYLPIRQAAAAAAREAAALAKCRLAAG